MEWIMAVWFIFCMAHDEHKIMKDSAPKAPKPLIVSRPQHKQHKQHKGKKLVKVWDSKNWVFRSIDK